MTAPSHMSSYASGALKASLVGETIGDNLRRTAARSPDHPALVSCRQDIRWNYQELVERVDRCASGLLAAGIAKGDRIGLWAPNCAEWTVVQYATASVGAIQVNVNPAYRAHELSYALRQAGVKLLIAAPGIKGCDFRAMAQAVRLECPSLEDVVFLGDPAWERLADAAIEPRALAERASRLSFDDPINIQYTSGTTGAPKGATLSHHNILNNALSCADLLALTERTRSASRFRSTTASGWCWATSPPPPEARPW
jgi:fatty-acyl-CoA synthase